MHLLYPSLFVSMFVFKGSCFIPCCKSGITTPKSGKDCYCYPWLNDHICKTSDTTKVDWLWFLCIVVLNQLKMHCFATILAAWCPRVAVFFSVDLAQWMDAWRVWRRENRRSSWGRTRGQVIWNTLCLFQKQRSFGIMTQVSFFCSDLNGVVYL